MLFREVIAVWELYEIREYKMHLVACLVVAVL
jgi:hypothetical protein